MPDLEIPWGSMAYMSPGLFPDVDAARLRHGRQSGEQIITDLPKISEYAQTSSRADTIDMLL